MLQEMKHLRVQQSGAVEVKVDSADSVELLTVLEEMRKQYEELVIKNKQDAEKWFQNKVRWESNMHKMTKNKN